MKTPFKRSRARLLLAASVAALFLFAPNAFAEHGSGEHGSSSEHGGGVSDHSGGGGPSGGGASGGDHGGGSSGEGASGGGSSGGDHGGGGAGGGASSGGDSGEGSSGGGASSGGGDHGGGGTETGGENSGGHGGDTAGDDHGGSTQTAGGKDTGDKGGDDSSSSSSDDSGKSSGGSGKSGSDDDSTSGTTSTSSSSTSPSSASGTTRLDLARDRDGREYRAHELVAVGDAEQFAQLRARGLTIVEQHALSTGNLSVARFAVPDAVTPEAVLADIKTAMPDASVDLNGISRIAGDTPRKLASLTRAPAPRTSGGMVGVIDTGIDPGFGNLPVSIVARRSFTGDASASDPHGTLIASIVAAHGSRLMSANVFAPDTAGRPAASADAIARAIDWLVVQRVPVINLSFSGPPNAVVARELIAAQNKGVIIVAAAGNDGPAAPPDYPAAYNAVVAVTATDKLRNIYRYANRGGYIMFAARGVDVETHQQPPAQPSVSGTSYAAPIVSSAIAEYLITPDAKMAQAALAALRAHARDLGAPGRDAIYGYGLIGE
jgi:hypothetical protein